MNFREVLKNPSSIGQIDSIADVAGLSQRNFQSLFELAFDSDKSIAWRAGWACDKVCRKNPELLKVDQIERILNFVITETHKGVLRSLLSILNEHKLPENLPVEFINICFERMVSPKADVSHQVLSMKILYKLCQFEPAFREEFRAYLENISPQDYTPGFNSTRKKILKAL